MTVANRTFGMALAVALISQHLWAQPAPPATKLSSKGSIETFYLTTPTQQDGANELAVAVRNILPPDAKIFFVPNQNAFTVLGTPEELVLARQIIGDLDRPKRTYRLAYTVTETDNGKRIGKQHYSMVVATGQRAILRQGSKVPIAMESYIAGSSPAQRQLSYIAVGTNFDASLDESANGVRLRTKVERLSVAEERSGMSSQPVMRQISLEGTSFATLGKRLPLASMDIPRQYEASGHRSGDRGRSMSTYEMAAHVNLRVSPTNPDSIRFIVNSLNAESLRGIRFNKGSGLSPDVVVASTGDKTSVDAVVRRAVQLLTYG